MPTVSTSTSTSTSISKVSMQQRIKSSAKVTVATTPSSASTPTRSTFRSAGNDSPDSAVFNSNISSSHYFSSASGSADRCSFGSDHPDLTKCTGSEGEGHHESSLYSPDLDRRRSSAQNGVGRNKLQEYIQESEKEEEADPTKVTFSHALKVCKNRLQHKKKSEVEPAAKKLDRRRPASLDLNYPLIDAASSSSPRLPTMKKTSANPRRSSGTFPSPGTPNYTVAGTGVAGGGLQKGWSSERVPLPASSARRYAHCAPLPLNGRSVPSKWEDAEKWIFSPVAGDGAGRASAAPLTHRRPKSKSGPLGAPGYAYYAASSSPLMMPVYDGGRVGGFTASSPFSAGVLGVDAVTAAQGLCRSSNGMTTEPCIARSVSVHGWSEVTTQASLPSSQEESGDGLTGDNAMSMIITPVVTTRDMATQMSPEGSAQSSPGEKPCPSPLSSIFPVAELPPLSSSSKLEIRDVEVDDCITLSQWTMQNSSGTVDKGLTNLGEWRKKAVEARASAWDVTETSKSASNRMRREEAKIIAWENLQKAKAEAEIRKLEMKLEKIRTSSMDKIMNKLRSAQRKAQEMRSSANGYEGKQVSKTTGKILSFRKGGQIASFSGCFTCHAF